MVPVTRKGFGPATSQSRAIVAARTGQASVVAIEARTATPRPRRQRPVVDRQAGGEREHEPQAAGDRRRDAAPPRPSASTLPCGGVTSAWNRSTPAPPRLDSVAFADLEVLLRRCGRSGRASSTARLTSASSSASSRASGSAITGTSRPSGAATASPTAGGPVSTARRPVPCGEQRRVRRGGRRRTRGAAPSSRRRLPSGVGPVELEVAPHRELRHARRSRSSVGRRPRRICLGPPGRHRPLALVRLRRPIRGCHGLGGGCGAPGGRSTSETATTPSGRESPYGGRRSRRRARERARGPGASRRPGRWWPARARARARFGCRLDARRGSGLGVSGRRFRAPVAAADRRRAGRRSRRRRRPRSSRWASPTSTEPDSTTMRRDHAGRRALDLHVDLVGQHLADHVTLGDGVAGAARTSRDLALGHGHRHLRHADRDLGHQASSSVRPGSPGRVRSRRRRCRRAGARTAVSSAGAYGIGASRPESRRTGASSRNSAADPRCAPRSRP